MTNESSILLEEFQSEFKNYKNYLDSNDWHDDVYTNYKTGKIESPKLDTEVSIISTILKSITKFKEDVGEDYDKKPIQSFIKFTSNIINNHINKIQLYKKKYPLNKEASESEVEFHSDLFALITKTKVSLSKLNIDENEASKKSKVLFFGDAKAPLLMRNSLEKSVPFVKDKIANLGLDFNAPSVNPSTSKELLINMKASDIPPWDSKKHFFEQEKSTIQFWEEERIKMTKGININGYHLSPWLYWHINIYKMAYGSGQDKGIKVAQFRDNEFFFDHMDNKARAHGRKAVFMYGTRRFAKSAGMTSKLMHGLYTIENAQGTVQGFSEVPDLKAIITYADTALQNMYPALAIPATSITLKEGISLGIKGTKAQDRYIHSELTVINLEGGTTKRGSQKTAGSTPDIFLLDEAGKGDCIPAWKAALPSFAGDGENWRLVPLISGTAGEGALSLGAETMLKNPDTYNILPMDWDFLEEFVDPDHITWKRNSFGFFVPAQMSLEAPPKKDMKFGDFLGQGKNKELNNITIKVTDWGKSKEFFEGKREIVSNDLVMLAGETNSFPLDPEDCYVTTEVNIFPGLEARNRRAYVEDNGLDGQKYRLYKNADGTFHAEMSSDPVITTYPYKGSSIDAPVVMLENPLLDPTPPPLGLYCIGFDDVKHDKTDGDSVMSATIYKRSFEGGEWASRFVGWYDSRPDKKKTYYKQLYILMKIFNARLLHENADNGFIEHLEDNHPDDLYIHVSTGIGLASQENLNRNQNRPWGWAPTPTNIYHANQKLVMYTKADGLVVGSTSGLSGVDVINHPMLLEELYKFKHKQNADRIRSSSLALMLAQYYDRTHQFMKYRTKTLTEEEKLKKNKPNRTARGLTDSKGLVKW